MGGDDSQKLLSWRGIHSPPGRKPPAHLQNQHCSGKLRGWGICRPPPPAHASRGRASATDCLGHSWQADLGHFSRAPKSADVGLGAQERSLIYPAGR